MSISVLLLFHTVVSRNAMIPIIPTTEASIVTVTGPVIDMYCWQDRNGFTWETHTDLKFDPYDIMVHNLINIPVSTQSGYAILFKANNNKNNTLNKEFEWDILYKMDNFFNIKIYSDIYNQAPTDQIGYEATVTGIDNKDGYLRHGIVSVFAPVIHLSCEHKKNALHCLVDAEITIGAECGFQILYEKNDTDFCSLLYSFYSIFNQNDQDKEVKLNQFVGLQFATTGFGQNDNGSYNYSDASSIRTIDGPLVGLICSISKIMHHNINIVHCSVQIQVSPETYYTVPGRLGRETKRGTIATDPENVPISNSNSNYQNESDDKDDFNGWKFEKQLKFNNKLYNIVNVKLNRSSMFNLTAIVLVILICVFANVSVFGKYHHCSD